MAHMIRRYQLRKGSRKQSIDMQRRARVIHLSMGKLGPVLHTIVEEDANTKAFDVRHQRHFYCLAEGAAIPEGVGHVGSVSDWGDQDATLHVFESAS